MDIRIVGTVVHGDGYGKKLGFPTINLDTNDELPKIGVYAGTADLESKEYKAAIVISIIGQLDKVEAHLIGYNEDAYGKIVELKIGRFLREYKKFDTEEELINQITKDIESCKTIS